MYQILSPDKRFVKKNQKNFFCPWIAEKAPY
jgi:hypothetical protein